MDNRTDIVYAAEKPSIAGLLARHVAEPVSPAELFVHDDPSETGSFLISWRHDRYRLSPSGRLERLANLRRRA